MGHIINPMGHSLHAFFGFSCATDCHCIFLASFHTHYINKGIDPESETQNESQMSESNNKTTETESESEHHKYRQVSEKLWPWLYLNENKMFCKVGMKAGKKNTMTFGDRN
jgi:hypothetical protein